MAQLFLNAHPVVVFAEVIAHYVKRRVGRRLPAQRGAKGIHIAIVDPPAVEQIKCVAIMSAVKTGRANRQGAADRDIDHAAHPECVVIAVLAFKNMSDDAEQDYFCDGISEDILTALSKVRWFLVIARNSSFAYKGKSAPMKQIGEELGVSYLVEGSVRKSGERVRITAQLNDVATGGQLWAERYDRRLSDVFAVQDEITEAVVAAIEPQVCAAENFHAQRKAP